MNFKMKRKQFGSRVQSHILEKVRDAVFWDDDITLEIACDQALEAWLMKWCREKNEGDMPAARPLKALKCGKRKK